MPTLAADRHQVFYEVHGGGLGRRTLVAMGGWGTFCHGKSGDVPRSVLADFEVVLLDYRGLGESTDHPDLPATMASYAEDVLAVLDHLEVPSAHLLGMVGMGACVAQELAIRQPDRVRSLVMTGCWAWADPALSDQIESLRTVHREIGFAAFQRLTAAFSFATEFYDANRDRILGERGAWSDLRGRIEAHSRLVDACLAHDVRDRLPTVRCPSLVLHAGRDPITTPAHTRVIEELIPGCRAEYWDDLAHVVAGREQRTRFDALLRGFYADVAG